MKKFLEEFKSFALRGNVMDMAVGVLIGGAFSGSIHIRRDFRVCISIRVFGCEFPDHGVYLILSFKSNE